MPLLEKDLNELPAGQAAILQWAAAHDVFCWLDGSSPVDAAYAFPALLAVGVRRRFELDSHTSLESLDDFLTSTDYGYIVQVGYGLKDRLEGLHSRHVDPIGFPALYLFEPLVLIRFTEHTKMFIQADDPEAVWQKISTHRFVPLEALPSVTFQARCTKDQYFEQLNQVRAHLQRGDCYELNYCQEFFATDVSVDPLEVYHRMHAISRAPFSCLYRCGARWLIGASPERFLKRIGDQLESRPMKGTAPRDHDPLRDAQQRDALKQSEKDRSENIMVVDLVRNDLSRIAARGSVVVDSLCEVRSFSQVHQLVSTVRGRVAPGTTFREILAACFPMGSMTGAPKRRVMELTDLYEFSARGLYSGSIGFMEPNGDFDLNVVIRSLQYESGTSYLSYHVGSGITIYSEPDKEWEECHWKSRGIRSVFGS